MTEDSTPPVLAMCSGCHTPTPIAEVTVLPGWRADIKRVFTNYRCPACVPASLQGLREAVSSGGEVRSAFCDFLEQRGYARDAATIRAAPAAQQEVWLLRLVDALESGALVLEP